MLGEKDFYRLQYDDGDTEQNVSRALIRLLSSTRAPDNAAASASIATTPGYSKSTIVTAFYRFPSKHTFEEYKAWISNFLRIQCSMVVFVDSQTTADLILELRPSALRSEFLVKVKPLSEQLWSKTYDESFWNTQKSRDPEACAGCAHEHISPDLYKLWDGKSEFMTDVVDVNPFGARLKPIWRHRSPLAVKMITKASAPTRQMALVCALFPSSLGAR